MLSSAEEFDQCRSIAVAKLQIGLAITTIAPVVLDVLPDGLKVLTRTG
ncbi:MAG: hypothetical protein WAN22_28000 [Solirubrobacteraceae bacterium]